MPYWEEPIWNMHYNFHFINSPRKWGTTAPEAHWAQVLPDPHLRAIEVTYPYYIEGALQLLCYKISAKMHGCGHSVTRSGD